MEKIKVLYMEYILKNILVPREDWENINIVNFDEFKSNCTNDNDVIE